MSDASHLTLPLNSRARIDGQQGALVYKVVGFGEFEPWPPERCAVLWPEHLGEKLLRGAAEIGYGALLAAGSVSRPESWSRLWISGVQQAGLAAAGDVIRPMPQSQSLRVLYRRDSRNNFLLVTERCNSRCLMCSQPPKEADDSFLVKELREIIRLVDPSEKLLGFTGGEPTLLGPSLVELISDCKSYLPSTQLHILTNGRRFEDIAFTHQISAVGHPAVTWAIPLYADSPDLHDFIVQAKGAFHETTNGLYNLANCDQRIEIRIVVHRQSLKRLRQLGYFIFHNLPFVAHVAIMGMEPIGYVKHNVDLLWEEPPTYVPALEDAVSYLASHGMRVSLYNYPLCALPKRLWPFARQSISDWKNRFVETCERCAVRDRCGGLFASAANDGRFHRLVRAIPDEEAAILQPRGTMT